jgi:biotin transport system substrate-specific component
MERSGMSRVEGHTQQGKEPISTMMPRPIPRSGARSFKSSLAGSLILSLLMAALIAIGARVSFPLGFTDVPVSLQVFFVLLSGSLLGARLGALSVAEYLMAGLMGAPVFAEGLSGPQTLAGLTGGYLIGFWAAAAFVGWVADRRAGKGLMAAGLMIGVLLIYLCGAAWMHFGLARPWGVTLGMGILPFVAVDALKALAVWAIVCRIRR